MTSEFQFIKQQQLLLSKFCIKIQKIFYFRLSSAVYHLIVCCVRNIVFICLQIIIFNKAFHDMLLILVLSMWNVGRTVNPTVVIGHVLIQTFEIAIDWVTKILAKDDNHILRKQVWGLFLSHSPKT